MGIRGEARALVDGPGQIVGLIAAAAAAVTIGPRGALVAYAAGAATGNRLIRQRPMSEAEASFARQVFGDTLPVHRIVLTSASGLHQRKFTSPTLTGRILVNLGAAFDDPTSYSDDAYPAPGKLLIHELAHAWQFHHAPSLTRMLGRAVVDQLRRVPYAPGDERRAWADYNVEQQATIVDEWFAPGPRGPRHFGAMRPEHPYYRLVQTVVRARPAPRRSATIGAGAAIARVPDRVHFACARSDGAVLATTCDDGSDAESAGERAFVLGSAGTAGGHPVVTARRPDHLDVFWRGRDGAVRQHWWDAQPGRYWTDHEPETLPVGGDADASFTAVGPAPDQLDLFWVDPTGAVQGSWWCEATSSWSAPALVTRPGDDGAESAPPGAIASVARTAHTVDLFWVGGDAAIWTATVASRDWVEQKPTVLAPAGSPATGTPLAAVATSRPNVFWIAEDGSVRAARGAVPVTVAEAGAALPRGALAATAGESAEIDLVWVAPDASVRWARGRELSWGVDAVIAAAGSVDLVAPLVGCARSSAGLDVFWRGTGDVIGGIRLRHVSPSDLVAG